MIDHDLPRFERICNKLYETYCETTPESDVDWVREFDAAKRIAELLAENKRLTAGWDEARELLAEARNDLHQRLSKAKATISDARKEVDHD